MADTFRCQSPSLEEVVVDGRQFQVLEPKPAPKPKPAAKPKPKAAPKLSPKGQHKQELRVLFRMVDHRKKAFLTSQPV